MPSLEDLKRRIESTTDLRSVVKTMKALAAVNIRQFEKAAATVETYSHTVTMGLQVVLRSRLGFTVSARPARQGPLGAVVFGTDQGMCGAFNETVVRYAVDQLGEANTEVRLAGVGMRAVNHLVDQGWAVQRTYAVPGAVAAVTALVQQLVIDLERWIDRRGVERVLLIHCRPTSGAAYRPHRVRLLPVDRRWLQDLQAHPWPTNQLPWYAMDWEPLFAALIREYLFVSLYRAAVDSLAAENASRLAAMQRAESNIEERLEELTGRYRQERQSGITEELQDIVAGFEALQ